MQKNGRTLTAFLASLSLSFTAGFAQSVPLRQVLTSAQTGVHADSWKIGSEEVKFQSSAAWSVRKYTLHGGRQEGVDIIEVNNGRLRFQVIPTRGMNVFNVRAGDVRLGWDSPVKEVVHPKFINLESRNGLGWLEGFNEWMVHCGLEWAGHPGKDKFINNVGDQVEMNLTLHGKMANIPASEVEVVIDEAPPHRIHVRGLVEERMFYGADLSFWTDISTEPDSLSLRFEDTLTNNAAHAQEFQIIYHSNYGPPLLEPGARFVGAVERVTPFNEHAAEGLNTYDQFTAPREGFVEQVYCLRPLADAEGRSIMLLKNAAGDRAVSLTFPVKELPCFTLWKNLGALDDGYVTGLEPGTGYSYTRRIEREAGRVPKLAAHESRQFILDVTIYLDKASVSGEVTKIEKIQAGTKPVIEPHPAASE
jgi:hypothetical protein